MSKNKLPWIIVLILVIALPVAYAQTAFGTSQIILVLINAVVVGVVLFLLQAIMMPAKEPKEKSAVWVAIFAFSLFIALYFGRTDFIWRSGPLSSFFEIHVFVNAFVIGIVLYFALGVMNVKEKLGKSPEAQKGYGIMIFIGALVWAIGIASSYGKIYVWQAYSYFISYFIGPEGILNPYPPQYRLLVFAGSFFLLSFFFNNYLIPDAKNTRINYGLALILAMNMASSGVTISSVIILGEIVFVLVLQKALLTTAKDNSLLSWIMAITLVGWASAAMTYGTQYQGFLGGIIGFIWKWGGWGSLVAIAVIILFLSWGIGRGETRNRVLNEGITRLKQKALDLVSRNETLVDTLGKWFSFRQPSLEGEIHTKIKGLRLEIYTLMNWMLRHDVWSSKKLSFEVLTSKIEKEEEKVFQKTVYARESPARSIKTIMEGSPIIKNNAGFWELGKSKETLDDGTEVDTQGRRGIGHQHWLIYELANFIKLNLEHELRNLPLITDDSRIEDEANTVANLFSEKIREHTTAISDYYSLVEDEKGRYFAGFRRFGLASWIRSYRLYFLDMYNAYGVYKRGFFFAKPDAIPDYYDYSAVSSDGDITRDVTINKSAVRRLVTLEERRIYREAIKKNETSRTTLERNAVEKINRIKKTQFFDEENPNRLRANFETGNYLLELDLFGYCLKDWNNIAIDGASKTQVPYIRRFHREDMWELYQPMDAEPRARFSKILTWSLKDWEFGVLDFGRGSFHPFSKKWADYAFITEKGFMDYSTATFKTPLNRDQLAFDREGLKAPHKMAYWGRRNYWDEQGQNLLTSSGIVNPYPALSVEGLWEFITAVAKRSIKDPKELEKLMLFQMEYEYLEKAKKGGTGG